MTMLDSDYMMENGASGIPLAPEEEKGIVEELSKQAESNLKEGNLYYVVSNRWYTSWERYTRQDVDYYLFDKDTADSRSLISPKPVDRPGPIDNSDILVHGIDTEGNDLDLRRSLQEGCDYILAPQLVWEKLFCWYKGGPALPRNLISQGDFNKQFNVEVFPLCLKLIDSRDNRQLIIRLSKKASLQELYQRVCALRGIEPEKARIWDYFNKQKHEILQDSLKTLEKAALQMDQDILLEVQEDGFWPSCFSMDSTGNELALVPIDPSRSSGTIEGSPSLSNGHSTSYGGSFNPRSTLSSIFADTEDSYDISKTVTKADRGGFAGLQNLGNTCFMNSAIQCLVHTPPIVEYFLQDYSNEINEQNPLGLHGELAVAFGELLRKLWSSGRTAIAPRAFKGKLGRFAPQFSGFNQHDSQELLAFLLDGLHEDLNRVKQKPYFEIKDSDGRPDEEVADECWRHHKARNDSIIVDVCQGQYKSTLVCPVCNKISITFDPFMYLSLPLPSTVTRTMTVTVFYSDGSVLPMPYTVTVLQHGCCKDLSMALGTACCLSSDESLLLAEVYDYHICHYFDSPLEPLSSIKDGEHLVAYRFPKKWEELTRLEICHRYLEKCSSDNLEGSQRKLFLTPLVTYLENPQTGTDIDLAVYRVLSPLRRKTYFGSAKINGGMENGSFSEANDESTNCLATHNGLGYQSMQNGKLEGTSSEKLNFQLCISNGRGFSCWPLSKNSPIKPGQLVHVMLDWTYKEQELYDSSYLKDLPVVHKVELIAKKTPQEAVSLFSCLDAFLKEEPLGPDDMWYCPSCKEHRQATKKLDLWRLPDVLVFHLKRFSYSRYLKNKLDTFVNFPIHNLDLSKYVRSKDAFGQSHVYELYAISNHYGGLGGGHYTAYAKLIEENSWYHFDDARVSSVSEADIKSSAAYVLFYQRVKVEPNAGPVKPSQDQVNP
ncbi:ubiquitin carboxyl-terminal hydrolase 9-like isoform X2 [Rhododendron vialii]|nr:ubiquitin carboxyl-terminal hydrolase 9-like isoform X2 [Rhododendron vialii]XP_058203139.1 ubiquitin carboxyl-terminal hydrolase 9-like isoform X2 [Rhododendron vialii]